MTSSATVSKLSAKLQRMMEIKLGHGNGDRLGYHGGHAPTMEIILVFQKMDNKVKDGLVLSIVWS